MKKLDINWLGATLISGVFNPILLYALIYTIVVIQTKQNLGAYALFLSAIFLPVTVFLFWYVYIKKKGHIKLLVWNRSERDGIYLMGTYTALFATIFFSDLKSSFWIINCFLMFLMFGTFYLLNKYIDKASLHAGTYAFLVFYLSNYNLIFLLLLIFLPLIYWSRIFLHKHTWLQLFLGTTAGMVIGILSWAIVIRS